MEIVLLLTLLGGFYLLETCLRNTKRVKFHCYDNLSNHLNYETIHLTNGAIAYQSQHTRQQDKLYAYVEPMPLQKDSLYQVFKLGLGL